MHKRLTFIKSSGQHIIPVMVRSNPRTNPKKFTRHAELNTNIKNQRHHPAAPGQSGSKTQTKKSTGV